MRVLLHSQLHKVWGRQDKINVSVVYNLMRVATLPVVYMICIDARGKTVVSLVWFLCPSKILVRSSGYSLPSKSFLFLQKRGIPIHTKRKTENDLWATGKWDLWQGQFSCSRLCFTRCFLVASCNSLPPSHHKHWVTVLKKVCLQVCVSEESVPSARTKADRA